MHWTSPRESVGLRMFAASSEPSAEPAPISEWISSMNMITSSEEVSSEMMPFRRSSNCPRYFVPATTRERSRARMRLLSSEGGTSPSTMRVASPSTIAVFPTPGSPRSTGLFFRRRDRTWTTRSSSISRPISGSNTRRCAISERSRANSLRNGVSFFFFGRARRL